MPKISETIKTFFSRVPHNCPEMAVWYSNCMEVQVMVAAGGGDPVPDKRNTWSNGIITWSHLRIPKNADTEPINNDFEIRFPLHEFVESIGMTGWDFVNKKSIRVGFDFDAIVNHATGISDEELTRVREAVEKIPQAWLFRSTSGSGLHLYLEFDPENAPQTQNHHEHAALARACLGVLSNLVNFNFAASLDVVGGNMWNWSRKMTKENQGLSLLKRGEGYFEPPFHWQDHIDVVNRKRAKVQITGSPEDTDVETMAASRRITPLDTMHRRIIEELQNLNYSTFWVADHNLLQTHTCALAEVFKLFAERGNPLQGHFKTLSDGSDPGKPNVFCFPCSDGAFKVVRFGNNTTEDKTWCQDSKGWTFCYFNRKLDLQLASASFGGDESASRGGGFTFPSAREALEAVKSLGGSFVIPDELLVKPTTLKPHKDGRVVVEIRSSKAESSGLKAPGFIYENGKYHRILNIQAKPATLEDEKSSFDIAKLDQTVRALLTTNHDEAGWSLHNDELNFWARWSKDNIRSALKASNFESDEVEIIIGRSIIKSWTIVNIPFAPEYPGNRQWNMNSAQFRFTPAEVLDDAPTMHPHWDKVLAHCGDELNSVLKDNEWARKNGIITGRDYLLYWVSALVRYPFEPLPFLFFFGPQNSGKSIFHEALALLVKNHVGIEHADQALINPGGFNGELANAFLCVIEETDLSKDSSTAYNRIKDWVTSPMIAIHPKRMQVYTQRNTTHWVQCSNSRSSCPVFPGDTRITMCYVPELEEEIPKYKLLSLLEAEAPYFMATLMSLKLPDPEYRLRIPTISTGNKDQAEDSNRDDLSAFLNEYFYPSFGRYITFAQFMEKFLETVSSHERHHWTKQKILQEFPICYPIGRYTSNKLCIGNISEDKPTEPLQIKFIVQDKRLVLIPC